MTQTNVTQTKTTQPNTTQHNTTKHSPTTPLSTYQPTTIRGLDFSLLFYKLKSPMKYRELYKFNLNFPIHFLEVVPVSEACNI